MRTRLIVAGAGVTALTVLTVAEFSSQAAAHADGRLFLDLRRQLAPVISQEAAAQLTRLGQPEKFAALCLAILAVAVAADGVRGAGRIAAAIAGAALTTQALQELLRQPRPLGRGLTAVFEYPSGHTTAAVGVGVAAVLVAAPAWRPLAAGLGTAAVLAMSGALLVTGSHLPSDILAGAFTAGVWLVLVARPTVYRHPVRARAAWLTAGPALAVALLVMGAADGARALGSSVAAAPVASARAGAALGAAAVAAALAYRFSARRRAARTRR